jgi:hypothetical protein
VTALESILIEVCSHLGLYLLNVTLFHHLHVDTIVLLVEEWISALSTLQAHWSIMERLLSKNGW